MAVQQFEVYKELVVEEDLAVGVGEVTQVRGGITQTYNRINSDSIPMLDNPGQSVDDALKDTVGLDRVYSKEEADARFAGVNGSSANTFNVGHATNPSHAVPLSQLQGYEPSIDDITDLRSELDAKFDIDEHVVSSGGVSDAGKPVVLDSSGKLDTSMLGTISLNPRGRWTPTVGDEYPSDTLVTLDSWLIEGLDEEGYTYLTGSLIGKTAHTDDIIIYFGSDEWVIHSLNFDSNDFYLRDGSQAITADFANGGYKTTNLGNGALNSDGATLGQVTDAINTREPANANIQAHIIATNNPHGVDANDVGLGNVDNTSDTSKPISTATQSALDDKADLSALGNHTSNTNNPHGVDANDVGLDNVDNTSDTSKPVSTATQLALDDKADASALTDYVRTDELISTGAGIVDADKPVKTNGSGKIDSSLLEFDGLEYQGGFTPTVSVQYPVAPDSGQFWTLNIAWIWTEGDLDGQSADAGDYIVYGASGWALLDVTVDLSAYYKLDGTTPLIANFNAGGFKLSSVANGTENTDGATVGQLNTAIDTREPANVNIQSHISNTDNPHGVDASDIGLANVDNTTDLGKPISTATQLALDDKSDASELNDYVRTDELVSASAGIADANKPIKTDLSGKIDSSFLEFDGLEYQGGFTPVIGTQYPVAPEAGQFWTLDVAWTWTDGDLDGETASEGDYIVYGANGWSLLDVNIDLSAYYRLDGIAAITADFNAGGFKLSNVAAGTLDTDGVNRLQLDTHTENVTNPHVVTATQLGLGNVDNTNDLAKPISTATQSALDDKAIGSDLTSHVGDMDNPHGVDAGDIGLANVDDTSDLTKPISTATQSALNEKASISVLTAHISDVTNPHEVDAGDVGLASVDNTSDANKPISTATQLALNDKADNLELADYVRTDELIATSVGIADADKPVKTNGIGKIDSSLLEFQGLEFQGGFTPTTGTQYPLLPESGFFWILNIAWTWTSGDLNGKTASAGDHMVYGSNGWALIAMDVDMEAYYRLDGDSPITADFNAGGFKLSSVSPGTLTTDGVNKAQLDAHANSTSNPHAVTQADVGLSLVNNTTDLAKPISTATQTALNTKADSSTLTAHIGDSNNPHGIDAVDIGLGNVDNTSDASKPVSTATQSALNNKADTTALTSHTGNTNNPHSVNSTDVGLGSVNNTSDSAKPVSTATQTALNTKPTGSWSFDGTTLRITIA